MVYIYIVESALYSSISNEIEGYDKNQMFKISLTMKVRLEGERRKGGSKKGRKKQNVLE